MRQYEEMRKVDERIGIAFIDWREWTGRSQPIIHRRAEVLAVGVERYLLWQSYTVAAALLDARLELWSIHRPLLLANDDKFVGSCENSK